MAKAPAFQFYANDFMDATSTWPAIACGLYVRCLCKQWTHGAIPSDLKTLARATHCDLAEVQEAWPLVGPKFIDNGDGTLINKRLEEVRARQNEVSEERSKAGKAGAIAKANARAIASTKTKQRKVKVEGEVEGINSEGNERARTAPNPELVWPAFAGEQCKAKWAEFVTYRTREKKARYKTRETEQRALNLAARYFPTGPMFVEGLDHAMAKTWQFPVDPSEYKYPFTVEAAQNGAHNPRA